MPAAVGAISTAVERNSIVLPLQDLVVDRLLDARLVVVAERLHPAGALAHAQRRGVRVERDARSRRSVADLERRLPGR